MKRFRQFTSLLLVLCLLLSQGISVRAAEIKADQDPVYATTASIVRDLTLPISPGILEPDGTPAALSWESSNPEVVSVVDGEVTGLRPGTSRVTFEAADGRWGFVNITVVNPMEIKDVPGSIAVRESLNNLRSWFPEGTKWDNNWCYLYQMGGTRYETRGCPALTALFAHEIFGAVEPRELTSFSAENLRPGDVLNEHGYHTMVVDVADSYVTVVVGDGTIQWNRRIYKYEITPEDYTLLTYYPEGYVDPDTGEHIHEYAQVEVVGPTCTERGYTEVFCIICGDSYIDPAEYVDALGHDWGPWETVREATETEDGLRRRVCRRDPSHVEEERIPATGPVTDPNSGACGEDLTWQFDSGTVTISGTGEMYNYTGSDDSRPNPFAGRSDIKKVVFTEGCTSVGFNAFAGCVNLETVEFPPSSLRRIESGAFQGCSSLVSAHIPEGVTSLGALVFADCTSLTDLEFPSTVYLYGVDMFKGCTSLTTVTIPATQSYQFLPETMFENCTSLREVHLPDTLHRIQEGAFRGCTSLTEFDFTVRDLVDIEKEAFLGAGLTSATLPKQITEIGDLALGVDASGNPIPGFVIHGFPGSAAEDYANKYGIPFVSTENSWKLENGVLTISGYGPMEYGYHSEKYDDYEFQEPRTEAPWFDVRHDVREIVVEEGVTSISDYAFKAMPNLEKVTLPESMTSVGQYAFQDDARLTEVNLPDSITFMSVGIFWGCTALPEVHIPAGVTELGFNTFVFCESLREITIPDTVTKLGGDIFSGCSALTDVTLSGSLTAIPSRAFANCTALEEITIPEGVEDIYYGAFMGCERLRQVNLPDSVKNIGGIAFVDCPALTAIVIPAGVETIYDYALGYASYLNFSTGYIEYRLLDILVIHGYEDTEAQRYAQDNGIPFQIIGGPELPLDSGACGENITWTLSRDGVLILSGTGPMTDYMNFSPWYQEYSQFITRIEVGEGITTIGDYAFDNLNVLAAVSLPESLESIGKLAFYNCYSLGELSLPKNLKVLDNYSLYHLGVSTLELPEGLTTIGQQALSDCKNLQSLVIPNSVTDLRSASLTGSSDLRSVVLPEGLTTIPTGTLHDCTSLEWVYVPSSVTMVDNMVFRNTNLHDIYFGGSAQQWSAIHFNPYNEDVSGAVIHYNAAPPGGTSVEPTGDLGNFVPVQTYENQFEDVVPGSWYESSVAKAYELGLVKGDSATNYNRKGDIKIGETIALACRILSIYRNDQADFTAASGEKWYDVYVRYAIKNGIISEGDYAVYNVSATRSQFAAILAKALPEEELQPMNTVSDGAIPDVAITDAHASEIYLLYRAGVLTGSDSYGTFKPDSNIQRSEVAAIIVRMAIPTERKQISLS